MSASKRDRAVAKGVCGLLVLLTSLMLSSGMPASSALIAKVNLPSDRDSPVTNNIHLTLGNPSQSTTNPQNASNYLLLKQGYALSYNRDLSIPNWVSWQLNSSWFGSSGRTDNWNIDRSLPKGWYRVTPSSYKGSRYDRGHMTPSDDRTKSTEANSETFLMTNILPQAPDNNRGAWVELEKYSRELAREGKELYIIAGGVGQQGAIAKGKVSIPARVWKVIVVLDRPGGNASSINTNTRTIAVDMPNQNGISQDWQQYKTSIDKLEAATGYDFLSEVPVPIQTVIESRIDGEGWSGNIVSPIWIGICIVIAAIGAWAIYAFRHKLLKFLGIT